MPTTLSHRVSSRLCAAPSALPRPLNHSSVSLRLGAATPGLTSRQAAPAVLAAILGELLITVEEHPGASNPCEPQEPYESVSLSYMGVTRKHDAATDTYPPVAERVPIKMGTFSVIKRTGELDRMRACFE